MPCAGATSGVKTLGVEPVSTATSPGPLQRGGNPDHQAATIRATAQDRRKHPMKVEGSAALVTGANRGLGAAIAQAFLDSGAKVYGGARDTTSITNPAVIPVQLDVTSADDIDNAAEACRDVSIVVNNAGIGRASSSLAPDAIDAARAEMETNFFGPLRVSRGLRTDPARQRGRRPGERLVGALVHLHAPSSRPTARRRRPPGRSPTGYESSFDTRALSSSPYTPGLSTPTWPPVSTRRR